VIVLGARRAVALPAMRRPLVLVAGTLLAACGGSAGSHASGPCGPCDSIAGVRQIPRSPKLEQLAQQRVELARKRLVLLRASFEHGTTTLDELFAACRDVAFAARDSGLHGERLRHVLTEYRDAVVALKELTRERLAKGSVGEDAVNRVDSLVAEAEYWLGEASEGL
jgi:hypothetical protein